MKKKLLVLLLVALLVLSVLATNAFAGTEEDTTTPMATASWTTSGSVTVDGNREKAWSTYHKVSGQTGAPEGKLGFLWNEGKLYLAVNSANTDSLALTINGKTANVDLTALTVSGATGNVAKKDSFIEIEVSLADFDFTLLNYTQTVPMSVALTNATGTSVFTADLAFSAKKYISTTGNASYQVSNAAAMYGPADNINKAKASGQLGGSSTANAEGGYDYRMWNIYQEGKTNYSAQRIFFIASNQNDVNVSDTVTLDFDIRVDDMPVYKDPTNGKIVWRQYQPAGLGIWLGQNIQNGSYSFTISHTADGLVMYACYGNKDTTYGADGNQYYGPYKLGKQLGEEFHISLHTTKAAELEVYVDDVLIHTFQGVGRGAGSTMLNFNLWSACYSAGLTDDFLDSASAPKNADANSDVTIRNIKIGNLTCSDLMDSLTFDTIKGTNASTDKILSNLTLPGTLNDGQLSTALNWSSSPAGYISATGELTSPEKDTDVVLTATIAGSNPAITKKFNLTLVVPPIDAWRADSVTMDGNVTEYHDFARGYTFAPDGTNPSGAVAARWTKDALYIGVKYENSKMLGLQIGNKIVIADLENKILVDEQYAAISDATLAVGTGTAELALPLSYLNLQIQKGTEVPMGVIFANDTAETGKNLRLGFFGASENAIAAYGNSITVNGSREGAWNVYHEVSGRSGSPEGQVGFMWAGGKLYLAVNSANTESLALTINGKTANVDLAALTVSGATGKVAKTGNFIELEVSMADFDFTLLNYTQTVPVMVELTNTVGTSAFTTDLAFSARKYISTTGNASYQVSNAAAMYGPADNINKAKASGQLGGSSTANAEGGYDYRMWNIYQEGKPNYSAQRIFFIASNQNDVNVSDTVTLDFDVRIDDMPVYKDPTNGKIVWRQYQPAGLGIWLGQNIQNGSYSFTISHTADGLVMYACYGNKDTTYGADGNQYYGPYKLGKQLGEEFHISLHTTKAAELEVYVDDVLIHTFQGVGRGAGSTMLNFNLWSACYSAGLTDDFLDSASAPKNADANSDVTIRNIKIGNLTCSDLMDSLTFDTIKNANVSTDLIMSDLTLPTNLTDGQLSAPLTWTSSNENAISSTGTVNTDNDGKVTLTATVVGAVPANTKQFSLNVTLSIVDAWKGSAYTEGRGYTFNSAGKPNGEINARWDDTNLYLQLENTNATNFSAVLGGKTYSASVSGGKAEIKVPLSSLNLGTITNTTATTMNVTLTNSTGSASKKLQLSFFGAPVVTATNWENNITVNGTADEGAWQFYRETFGRPGAPVGKVSALWSAQDLYLAVKAANVNKLYVTLNGKTATIDLTTLAVTGMNNVTVKKSGDTVEMKIPFASFDFTLVNYGQKLPALIEIEGAGGTSGFAADLTFTSMEYVSSTGKANYQVSQAAIMYGPEGNVNLAYASGQLGGTSVLNADGGYTHRMWNIYQEGKTNYSAQRIFFIASNQNDMSVSDIGTVEFDVRIDDMPVYKDPTNGKIVWRKYQPAGLGIYLGRSMENGNYNFTISHTADGLVMYACYGNKDTTYGADGNQYYGPYKLGKQLGEEFHMSLHTTNDGKLAVYVDDVLIHTFEGVGRGTGSNQLNFNLWSTCYSAGLTDDILDENSAPKNADANSDVTVSNIKIGNVTCYDLRDLVTFDDIKGMNGNQAMISKDLNLPDSVADGTKLESSLVWNSSNTNVITNDGKVSTQTKDTKVTMTAKLGGKAEFSKSFDLLVVLPTVDAWRTTSANVNATLAEYHNFERGYTFPAGTTTGAIAARWTKNTLYIGAKYTNADTLTITLGGKTIVANISKKTVSGVSGASIAVGSGTVELGIPMSQLGLGTVSQGTAKPMSVTFSKGSTKVQKHLNLTFYGVYETSMASWDDGTIAIDGILDEDWLMYTETAGRVGTPEGVIGKMWNGSDLFLAVDTDGADRLLVTMGGKTATIDLTAATLTDSTGLIQTIAKQGDIVEMKISFKDFFTLVNYGQVIEATIELVNNVGASGFSGGFEFTSREHLASINQPYLQLAAIPSDFLYGSTENAKLAFASGQTGYTSVADENGRYTYRMWNIYQPGKQNYPMQRVSTVAYPDMLKDQTGTLTLDFDLRIDDMPVYSDPTSGHNTYRGYQALGFGVCMSRSIDGEELNLVISNTKDGLVLYVGYGPFTNDFGSGTIQWDGPYKINEVLGEEFHVMLHYSETGELAFYADDVLVYEKKDVGADFMMAGGDNVVFSLWSPYYQKNDETRPAGIDQMLNPDSSPKNSSYDSDVTLSDVRIGKSTGTDLLDLITYDTIKGNNGASDSVVSNLVLPSVISDGKITAKLSWSSSNRGVITSGGTVYPPDERTPITMTVSMVGAKPAITKQFAMTAVMPFIDTWQSNFVKMDGDLSEYYGLARGYSFAASSTKPSASVAAGWNAERSRLYFAIKYKNTDTITITMGSRVMVIDVKNQSISGVKNTQMKFGKDTIELAVPFNQVRITEVENNMLYDITVKLENEKNSVSKNLTLAFYGTPSMALASWDDKTIVLDGVVDELSWLLYSQIQGRPGTPEGKFGKLWNGTDLYMAVDTDGAKKLTLQLGEKTLTVDLTKATPTASGMSGVKVVKQGDMVEMKIPMKSFGFTLHNYTETIAMRLELSNAAGTSGFYGTLQFASRQALFNGGKGSQAVYNVIAQIWGPAENIKSALATGQIGHAVEGDDVNGYSYHMWNIYQEDKENYSIQEIVSLLPAEDYQQMKAVDGTITVDFDVRIDDMPEYKDPSIPDTFHRTYQPNGLGIMMSRALPGESVSFTITNEKKGLTLYVGSGPFDNSYGSNTVQWSEPIRLGKELGEQFHVAFHQTMKGELQIYIDDAIVYEFKDAGADFLGVQPGLSFALWFPKYAETYNAGYVNKDGSPKNSDYNTDVYVGNVQVGTATCYDLFDYLDFDYIKANNGAYDNVITNLDLPGSLTDGRLRSSITWESSKPEVVSEKGKVTTQTRDTTVILKANMTGTEPVLYKELEVSVALPPIDSWYNAGVELDGKASEYHNFERGYDLEKVSGKPTGSVGAAWDNDTMYVAIKHSGADSVKIKIEGKTLTADLSKKTVSGIDGAKVAVGDGIVELAIPKNILKERAVKEDRVDMVVTLIKGDAETEKGLRMSFYGRTMDGIVGFGGDMVVDGSISETAYQMYSQAQGRPGTPEGLVGKVWSGKDLYLAVFVDDAKTMNLTLNGKTSTINISSLSKTGNLISNIAKGEYTYYDEKEDIVVKGTLIEMKIPFANFGFDMYAYGLTADMAIELISPAGVSAYNTKMAFTNKVAKNYLNEIPIAQGTNAHSGQVDPVTAIMSAGAAGSEQRNFDGGRYSYHMWNVYDEAGWGWVQRVYAFLYVANGTYEPNYVPTGDYFFDFDVRIDKLYPFSKSAAHSISSYGNNGLTFSFNRGIDGQSVVWGIARQKDEGLGFVIRMPVSTEFVFYPINKQLGEQFHVTLQWKDNGDLTVYIDDEKLCDIPEGAKLKEVTPITMKGYFSINLLAESNWNKLSSDEQSSDVTVSNILISSAAESDILQYVNFEDFKGENRRIDEVWKDMPLPSVVTDGVVKADVVWESSNPSVISIVNGVAKVTPQDEDTKVTLTVRMKGNKDIYRTFEITVTCPIVDAQLIETAKKADPGLSTYAKQVSYKLSDGSTVAAQWDKENIYLGVAHKGADTVNLTFGEKKIAVNLADKTVTGIEGASVAVSGNKAEITLPRAALGIEIPEYHATERFTVELAKSGKTVASKVLKLEFVGYESIADEYLNSQALKDFVATLKSITGDITLPQTYTSAFLDASVVLNWQSDTARVLDNNGKLTRPGKVDTTVRLSLIIDGKTIGVYDGFVKAKGTPDLQSTTTVQVPFTSEVKIDGSISEQNWSMNNNLVSSKAVVGQMGVQWDTEYLYMAFQYEKAKALTIELEGKTANINLSSLSVSGDLKIAQIKKGSYLELKIPMDALGLADIKDYGEKLKAKIMLDDGVFEGTLVLSSIQWVTTDNPEHRFGKDEWAMDLENASFSTTADGYYLYQNYRPDRVNGAGTSFGFSFANSTAENRKRFGCFEESGETGLYLEFDFQSLAMPVYTGTEDLQGQKNFIANNGFLFQMAGYANEQEAKSEWISAGMYMSKGGLVMVLRVGRNDYYSIPLGKHNGDMFRIGMAWTAEDTVHVYVDGERVYTLEDAVNIGTFRNKGGAYFSFQRSEDAAVCDSDSVRIHVDNVAMGYYYGDCILEDIGLPQILDRNMNPEAITTNLNLMTEYVNPQISSGKLTWASSDPAIASDGTVTRPEDKSYALTYLTVTNELGHSKEFMTAVRGYKELDDILYLTEDYDPAHGAGQKYASAFLTFDEKNTSVIKDMKESKKVSVVKLTELDHENRLYEDFLTLWVSDDNANYTEIKDFKFYQKGNETYLYGFEAEARFVKVHCTHIEDLEDLGDYFFPEMIDVYHEEIFGDNGGSFGTKKTVTVKNTESTDKVDWPWSFTAQELGIVSLTDDMADIRIFLGDEMLYHYVEDGTITVRIPEVKAGGKVKLKVLSGNKDAMDISNKESVYEIIYGTREFMLGTTDTTWYNYRIRAPYTLPDGTLISTHRANSLWDDKRSDCRIWSYSTDNGRTWKEMGVVEEFAVGPAHGGMVYEPNTNVLYSYGYAGKLIEGGESLGMLKLDLNNGIENAKWEFVCNLTEGLENAFNYNHGTTLSTADGYGPNIDMIIAYPSEVKRGLMSFHVRVSYTTDAGETWQRSDSVITIPGMEMGFETGVSECSTLELDDGTIVLMARYQNEDTQSFAYSFSTDQGITWADAVASKVYTSNTQAMFHETQAEFDLFTWAGNNILGGDSYNRWPLNVAIPVVEEDYSNIKPTALQNVYARTYFWKTIDDANNNSRATNHYLTHTADGALLFDMNYAKGAPNAKYLLRLDDYQDFVTKTKGSYDSFEKGNTKYEGWADYVGSSEVTNLMATDGEYSMRLFGTSVRTVPYFRNGSVSFDLNWTAGTELMLELATTISREFMEGSPVGLVIDHEGNILDGYGNDTGADVAEGWNKVELNVDLPNNVAKLSVNGAEAVDLKVDTTIGDYVTYVTMHADNYVYVDNFTQMGEQDDFWPKGADDSADGFDMKAILFVGLPLLVVIAAAVAVVIIRKKKAVKPVSDTETPDNA